MRKTSYAGILYPKQAEELENYMKYLLNSVRSDQNANQAIKGLILPFVCYFLPNFQGTEATRT